MKSSNVSIRNLFFGAWGVVTLFFQLPLVQMILDDTESLNLGGWDWKAFALFAGTTFLFLPTVAGLFFAAIGRISRPAAVFLLAVAAGCLFSMEINFHYLQFYFLEAAWRRYALIGMFAGVSTLICVWPAAVLRLLKTCALLSGVVFLAFLLQAGPTASHKAALAPAPPAAPRPGDPPVFFLTFEKIAANYVMDEKGRILADRFPNLAAFASEADYYPQAYPNATATIYGLKALYSGRALTLERDWMRQPTLRDIVGPRGKVFMLLEILTNYCDPRRHYCHRLLGREHLQGQDLIAGWYKTFLLAVMPDPWEQQLTLWWPGQSKARWHFNPWFDLWAREQADLKPGEKLMVKVGAKQIDLLKRIAEEEGTAPNLYLMHNYITDEPPMTVSLFKNPSRQEYEKSLELCRKNLEPFDREIGKLVAFLKERGIYDQALIVITADHGYDPGSRYVKGESELPASADLTRVFFALKRPGQKEGRVFRSPLRQVDVLPTVLANLGIDPAPYHFQGLPVTDPSDPATLEERPLEFHLTSYQAGVLHYRLKNRDGPLRRVR
ncbi:MAG: sulfatase-like hydrolase/transferase [Candidatus Omnitrophica bacterium]|nr:sulfatase-like hydrolase/transferase [Candidatus Omnitrophota bacterium]